MQARWVDMLEKATSQSKEATNKSAASVSVKLGERFALDADISHGGLALLAGFVTSILLSTSVIIFVARRGTRGAATSLAAK